MLQARDYTPALIDVAIARAKTIPREQALKCVLRQQKTNQPVFAGHIQSLAAFQPTNHQKQ